MNTRIDFYFNKAKKHREILEKLRSLVLDCGLTEELKWGVPCYTYQKKNIVMVHGFKNYCGLLFLKGALLKDPRGILIRQTENVQFGRQVRFTHAWEVSEAEAVLKAYIYEAIEVEKNGLKVPLKKTSDYKIPDEFQKKLEKNVALKKAFYALTPGRQRGYILYFSAAKQPQTREKRIEKYAPRILEGKGIHDYKL